MHGLCAAVHLVAKVLPVTDCGCRLPVDHNLERVTMWAVFSSAHVFVWVLRARWRRLSGRRLCRGAAAVLEMTGHQSSNPEVQKWVPGGIALGVIGEYRQRQADLGAGVSGILSSGST